MSVNNPASPADAAPLPRVELGFVSKDNRLCDFLVSTFQFETLASLDLPMGTLHRLQGYDTMFKVLVPNEPPQLAPRSAEFYGVTGIRFVTIRVTDLDGVVTRALQAGGRLASGPHEPVPGVRIAMIEDPDGNLIEASQRQP